MFLQKYDMKESCREDFYQSCYIWNLADVFSAHMEFVKYVQDKVVVVKDACQLLHSLGNVNTVWIFAVTFLIV